jgi:hypothetical protein
MSIENTPLPEDFSFSIITALTEPTIHYPKSGDTVNASPIFFVEFDQHVDAKKLVDGGHIAVFKEGSKKPYGALKIEKRATLIDLAKNMVRSYPYVLVALAIKHSF